MRGKLGNESSGLARILSLVEEILEEIDGMITESNSIKVKEALATLSIGLQRDFPVEEEPHAPYPQI